MNRLGRVFKRKSGKIERLRISFDLDEVLFVSPETHKTEPKLKFPFYLIFRERLRLGTPELIKRLQSEGFEVWVYTSSFRSEKYIRGLFLMYGIWFDDVINGDKHKAIVQRGYDKAFPNKMPNKFRISLHIDDEDVVVRSGRMYGYNVFQLDEQDDDWADKIMQTVYEIEAKEKRQRKYREGQGK